MAASSSSPPPPPVTVVCTTTRLSPISKADRRVYASEIAAGQDITHGTTRISFIHKNDGSVWKSVTKPKRTRVAHASVRADRPPLSVAPTVVKPYSERARLTVLRHAFSLHTQVIGTAKGYNDRFLVHRTRRLRVYGYQCNICEGRAFGTPRVCETCTVEYKRKFDEFMHKMRPSEKAIYPTYAQLRETDAHVTGALGALEARHIHSDSYFNHLSNDAFQMILDYCQRY